MTAAHDQTQKLTLVWRYPDHQTRKDDPNYHLFEEARKRIQAAGLYKCAVCGATTNLELHHTWIEFSQINNVDVGKLNELLGLHLTDQEFQTWVEGEGNLEVLCFTHHRGREAVHMLPDPAWNIIRVQKPGTPAVEVVSGNI